MKTIILALMSLTLCAQTVVVTASGESGDATFPTLQLEVNGTSVADTIKLTGVVAPYSRPLSSSSPVSGRLRLRYTNDAPKRNVYLASVKVDSQTFLMNDGTVTHLLDNCSEPSSTPGFFYPAWEPAGSGAWLNCGGYVEFPVSITLGPVVPPIAITSGSLSSGTVSIAYSQSLTATGGVPPYTWSIAGGALPSGVLLNSSNGLVAGVSVASGSFGFTAKVVDSAGATASKALTLTINPTPVACVPGSITSVKTVKLDTGAEWTATLDSATCTLTLGIPQGSSTVGQVFIGPNAIKTKVGNDLTVSFDPIAAIPVP